MSAKLPERFDTERLILREPREADARAIFAAYTQDPVVAHYMIWRPHTAPAETEAFIAECRRSWSAGLRRPYVLALAENEAQPIGMLEARPMAHIVDIGYVLARHYWGRGLMPEAISELARLALDKGGFFRLQATCDVDNRASARTLEKSGFIREGVLARHTVHPNLGAEPRSCFMYGRCR